MGQQLRAVTACAALCFALPALGQTQGVTANEILLGSSVDLTGPVSAIGNPMKLGFEVAADKINEAGGINGRKVRVIVDDNGYDPKRAVLGVQKLTGRDNVFAVIGVLGSAITQIVTPIVTEKGVPMLFAAAPTPSVYQPLRKLSFGFLAAYDLQMVAATTYAHDTLGKRRFCMMYQDDESGEQSLAGVERKLKVYGLSIVEKTSYKRGATDFSAQFARMRAANCDAVMLGTIVRETAGAALERAKIGWDVPLFAPQGAVSQSVIALGKDATEGVYGFTSTLPYAMVKDRPAVMDAATRFRAKTGGQGDPDDFFFVAYSGLMLFAEAAKNAGPALTSDSLVASLEKLKDYDTGLGNAPMTFTPDRRLGTTKVYAVQVKNGRWTLVKDMEETATQ